MTRIQKLLVHIFLFITIPQNCIKQLIPYLGISSNFSYFVLFVRNRRLSYFFNDLLLYKFISSNPSLHSHTESKDLPKQSIKYCIPLHVFTLQVKYAISLILLNRTSIESYLTQKGRIAYANFKKQIKSYTYRNQKKKNK